MKQSSIELSIRTDGRGFTNITRDVSDWVAQQGIDSGLLTLFCRHTSASLVIQENADPDVLADINDHFERSVPDDMSLYRHTMEGPDDMPAHIRTALTHTSLSIPVSGGRPVLGTWQAVYLFEHRTAAHRRAVALHLIGV